MALKRANIGTVEAPKAKKNDKPTFVVSGDDAVKVISFKAAKQAFDAAEAKLETLKKDLVSLGFPKLVAHNVANAGAPTSSIKLAAENTDSTVTLIMQDKYKAVNPDVAEQLFGDNVNDYVYEIPKVAFNTEVFNKTVDGKTEFDEVKYAAFAALVASAASQVGIENPLSVKTLVAPKPEFHAVRWSKFDAETNKEIQEAIPAVVYPRS